MLISVLSFVLAIIVSQQFSALPDTGWFYFLILFAIGCVFFRFWRLMFFVIGLLWSLGFASYRLADRLPDQLQGLNIKVEGKVIGLPDYDERRVRFDFAVLKPGDTIPKKLRLSWYFPKQAVKAGQYWRFTVKLKKPYGQFNPNGFDYERWLLIQNIGATGYVRNKPEPLLIAADPFWHSFSGLRQAIADKLGILLDKTENSGIIKALTIGDRRDISAKQWKVYRNTGTIHLMAISGLHIGIIAGLAYFLALKLAISLCVSSPQQIAAIVALGIAVAYSALAGFSLPTQRALIMLSIAMLALTWRRNITAVNTLALALFIVLIYDPLAVLSAGFWLSFTAVSMIIYSLSGRLGHAGYWIGSGKIHWVTAVGLTPLLLYYFQQFSIIAPLANLFAVPLLSLIIVPLCLLAVLSMLFSSAIAQQLLLWVDKLLQGVGLILAEMAELPFSVVNFSSLPVYALVLALIGVLILLSPRGMPGRWLSLVMFVPIFFVDKPILKSGEVEMTLLDVGQGLSAVIETSRHVLVFDTGAKYSQRYDMGKSVVTPFLKSKGITVIDTLLISHGDNDHMGGAQSIIEQFTVNKVLTSVPELLAQYSPVLCQSGQSWVWDQVEFDILSPPLAILDGGNNNSCVLKVSSKQANLLLTGDIETEAETWLIKSTAKQLASEILVAPHHGSKTSSTIAFLKQIKPTVVLIPSGYRNRFAFPHSDVLQRYQAINAKVFSTAKHGALIIKLKNNRYTVSPLRSTQGKYWNN